MGEGRGSREGPIPSTGRTWAETEQQGKQGQLASEPQRRQSSAQAQACPSPHCLAHSKVSHCFLSCSTEPRAGAGLMSCLVFRNKSSKGSLAS